MRGVHTVDKNKFIEAYNKWVSRELTIFEAAQFAGMSYPTFKKYVGNEIGKELQKSGEEDIELPEERPAQ